MEKRSTASTVGVDATWASRPTTGEWQDANNWQPAEVPSDTASFGESDRTGIQILPSVNATVNAIEFTAAAPSYTFTFTAPAPNAPALTIAGAGVSNQSGNPQQFVVASSAQGYENAQLTFTHSATAGGVDVEYAVGPTTPAAAGGGVIGFYDTSTAGAASFTVTTGAGTPPTDNSTVGGEVSFSDSSSAGSARVTVYGSTSTTDGDTFGNVVFHNTSSAAGGVFTNAGGTLAGGDGGNTQFYDSATGANGLFHNEGASAGKANGGDVAIDGSASAGAGQYHNHAATASGGYGGVTSFNNNAPCLPSSRIGASAGSGVFYNYGAKASGQGGGHTYFTAKFGSPTAAEGTFINYGSAASGIQSGAGHTVFSISLPREAKCGSGPSANYSPDAGRGVFWNFPGTADGAPGGYTEFTVYNDTNIAIAGNAGPTAGDATFMNMGAVVPGACGGQTWFSGASSAGNAALIAMGGVNGGEGGSVVFQDGASGGAATVRLYGNGTLDISDYDQPSLTIGVLELAGGCIKTAVGSTTTCLVVSAQLNITVAPVTFAFESEKGVALNTPYTILSAPNLAGFSASQFTGNAVGPASPTFQIVGNALTVTFSG